MGMTPRMTEALQRELASLAQRAADNSGVFSPAISERLGELATLSGFSFAFLFSNVKARAVELMRSGEVVR